jgi:NAD(P)-dependent dehydrogenase (short-subunit alcohol dehydrogenase family)
MPDRLKNKVAVVTGGAAGIGEATAVLFAEEGAKVVIADLDKAAGEKTVAHIERLGAKAVFVKTDVSDEEAVRGVCDKAVEHFAKLDILVNNAATFILKGIEATTEDWERSLRVNVVGSSLMSRYAVEKMKQSGGGAIVNLSSISAFIAQPLFVTYSATKAALLQMTRNMAMDLAPFNIRVNCVCPGTILTRATSEHMKRVGMNLEQFLAEQAPEYLLRRVGQPREVAYAILFLASDEASFITGTHLMVDGGYTAK